VGCVGPLCQLCRGLRRRRGRRGLRDVLRHLAARQPASCPAWLLETGSVRGKKNKNRDIGLYRLISVFESGRVSVVGLADNPPPELTEVGHYFLRARDSCLPHPFSKPSIKLLPPGNLLLNKCVHTRGRT
jgi:hypothetical protein